MKVTNLGGYPDIDSFVTGKIERFKNSSRDFSAMFDLMFSEGSNIMYEESRSYRIIKTTYAESRQSIIRRTAAVKKLFSDCSRNAVIGLYMSNRLEWIELFWAILRAGFRPLLMNLRLSKETLESVLSDMHAAGVITDSMEFSVKTVRFEKAAPGQEEGEYEYGSEVFCMSSGTSAHVKVCAYSADEFYYQIMDSAKIIQECAQAKKHVDGELKQLCFLPFYHIFGLVAVYVWFAFFSRTFVHLPDLSPDTLLNTVRRHRVTHIFAVPLFWETVYKSAMREIGKRGEATVKKLEKGLEISDRLGDTPFSALFSKLAFREVREGLFGDSVCFMISGGAMLKPEIIRFFNAVGYPLVDGYGMTELGITSVELSMKKKWVNSLSVGKPLSSVEYRLAEDGELLVRGKSTAKYVLEDGKRTDNKRDWFHTRDLARETDGHYYILGRKDELVVSASGENLNPNLIEDRCLVPGVQGCCLIPGGTPGEPVLVAVVSRYVSETRFGEIREAMKQRMQELNLEGQIAKTVYTTDPLLKGEEFKLNRIRIRKEMLEGTLTLPSWSEKKRDGRGGQTDQLTERVIRFFSEALEKEPETVSEEADFFQDLGGTSLDYLAMISQMQREFDIAFPSDGERSFSTVRAFCEYLREQLS